MSSFREKVIRVVKGIPEGETMSYGEVAASAGYPGAMRAVGGLMKGNHDPSVPCHRVVCSDRRIGGYNKGVVEKRRILEMEGVVFDGEKVRKRFPKIVTIGGGTGSFVMLSALKKHDLDITAIISMADDGGSTGVLRDQYGVLPPGDIRQALTALAESSDTLRSLFNYRFGDGSLKGHSFGNLFLAALEKTTGDFGAAVREASLVLNIKGKVVPITLADIRLHARLKNGKVIHGESKIGLKPTKTSPIGSVWLTPSASANPEAIRAIIKADLIIICPGSLYTSIIPNFLVDGVKEAVAESRAKKIYVANLMTKKGETDGMTGRDLLNTLETYMGSNVLDYAIFNSRHPSRSALGLYGQEEAKPIFTPRERLSGPKIVSGDFLASGNLIRHDPDGPLAEIILSLIS
ncbi:MAG: uridine diphosphate-N-acetylglucosamine-binding protein YvcK [Candidatus Colwellbacteria bacterium]|nr:uridine diphosphate-N-acetylglucosamine-binding protein YvcK [Candidatus Colwellbacteria bacterium]